MVPLVRLLCLLGASALIGCASPGARVESHPPATAELPVGLLPALAEELGSGAQWRPRATTEGVEATNASHDFNASFASDGLLLAAGSDQIHVALAGIGRSGELHLPPAAEAEVRGARVVYRHGEYLTQWFINSPLGLEQGFTLERRTGGEGELQLVLALAGDLEPRLEGNELVFTGSKGDRRLRYGALSVFDAEGKALPARMVLEGTRLVLSVDDREARYPVVIDPLFHAETQLTAFDGMSSDRLGVRVAFDGDTALVGAPYADPNDLWSAGAAYVFARSGGAWVLQAKLVAADAAANDHFGFSVALAGDTALVGAEGADVGGEVDAGAVYVFVRVGSMWIPQAKLTAAGATVFDGLGTSVAISGDTALAGALGAKNGSGNVTGAGYVFVRSGSTWSQQAKLTAADGAVDDQFGTSVAVDGNTALVGAIAGDGAAADTGAAYVFVRSGTSWSQQAKLTAAGGVSDDYFGISVALDGNTALVGAPQASPGGRTWAGEAHVFVRSGTSWAEQATLTTAGGPAFFGFGVALDGDTALIGAPVANSDTIAYTGAAYIFSRTGTSWTQQKKLTASNGAASDWFGHSVSLSGGTALVGASHRASDMGAAYLFESAIDLAIVKQDDVDPVRSGASFTYSLHVTNQDTDVDATGVMVTDTLPTGATYLSDDGGCTVNGVTVACPLGTLAKGGGTASIQITVQASTPGTLVGTASVSADQPDADPTNDSDTELTLVNRPPTAGSLTLIAYEGQALSGTLPASDADGQPISFAIVIGPTKGSAIITNAATGAFEYVPDTGATGTDTFAFKVNDGVEDSGSATVSVTILPAPTPGNVPPVVSSFSFAAYPGSAVTGTLPGTDANGDTLTFAIVNSAAKGDVAITDPATGAFRYTPEANASGTDTFSFRASDGNADSPTATVTIAIQAAPSSNASNGSNGGSNGSGGGALDARWLFGLLIASMLRRRVTAK